MLVEHPSVFGVVWRLWAWNTKYSKQYCIIVRSVMGVECGAHSGPGLPTFSSLSLSCCLPSPRNNMSSENSSCPQPRPCLHHVTRILPQIQHALPCRVNVLATYSLPTLPELTVVNTQYPSLCPMHALFSRVVPAGIPQPHLKIPSKQSRRARRWC